MLALIPGFILKLLGSGIIEKVLDHKRKAMDTATEREKIKLQGEIAGLEATLKEKQLIKELQIKELEHPIMWVSKFMLVFSVCLYWSMRFQARTWGFDDFSVEIKDLTDTEGAVSMIVMGSLFVNAAINKLKA